MEITKEPNLHVCVDASTNGVILKDETGDILFSGRFYSVGQHATPRAMASIAIALLNTYRFEAVRLDRGNLIQYEAIGDDGRVIVEQEKAPRGRMW